MINTSTRSFAHGEALWAKIRRRPSAGLLALLARRLTTFDADSGGGSGPAAGDELAARLPAAYRHPGDGLHAAYPLALPGAGRRIPTRLVAELRRQGIDVSTGTSNLVAVAAEDGSVPEQAAPADGLDRLPAELSRSSARPVGTG